jgi:hypothetical protein
MNKIKYLFISFLCAALLGGAAIINVSAQTSDKVLVSASGKTLRQSDVNTLIEFYEWAFETRFDAGQRATLQKSTEDEFRADPKGSRQAIDDVVSTFAQILAADEDVQAAARKDFLEAYLPDARKNTDPTSQMLLAIYENRNGSTQTDASTRVQPSGDSDESVPTGKVGNLSAIAGTWVWGSSGSMTTSTTGVYMGGNASRHTYQFNPDGTVEYTGIMNMMNGGCRMQIFKAAKGRATLNGTTLTINWSPASFSREDSCSSSQNYKKTVPAETQTFQIGFEAASTDRQLCLTGTDKMCLSRER